MEPIAPFSVAPARPRRVENRMGFAGIGQAFVALLIPRFWIGLLLIAGAIGPLAFPRDA